MYIASINHQTKDGAEKILSTLETSLKELYSQDNKPDMIIGPDVALNWEEGILKTTANNIREREVALKIIKNLSKTYQQTIIIPGTMLWIKPKSEPKYDNKPVLYNSAPAYLNGHMIKEFFKERNNGNEELAEKLGANYAKGNNKENTFIHKDKTIAIEICGDHGNQDARGSNLEIIMAYDKKAGFYLTAANDQWTRDIILCDGYSGTSKMFHYDAEKRLLTLTEPLMHKNSYSVYETSNSSK